MGPTLFWLVVAAMVVGGVLAALVTRRRRKAHLEAMFRVEGAADVVSIATTNPHGRADTIAGLDGISGG